MRWDFSMGRNPKLSAEQKVTICEQYLNGKKSAKELSQEFNVNNEQIRVWIKMYQSKGASAFRLRLHNATYTQEFKQQVVEAYLSGEGSALDLAIQYDIPSSSTLKNWIKQYNNLEKLKDYNPKPEVSAKKSVYLFSVNYRIEEDEQPDDFMEDAI